MATYTFETITAAEAAGFDAQSDSLRFATVGAVASACQVIYVPATETSAEQVVVTIGDRSVTFGVGIYGAGDIRFSDGGGLFVGGPGSNAMAGGANGDALFGGLGADTLAGGGGADLLQGNQGDDVLNGGDGADTVYGGKGDDNLILGDGPNFGQGNTGDDTITGGGSSDTIHGGQNNDRIAGGGGNDLLFGDLGDDVIQGDGGADTLWGGDGADVFFCDGTSRDASESAADRIMDWSSADRVGGLSDPDQLLYYEATAADGVPQTYAEALALANKLMMWGPAVDIVVIAVGADLLVFIDIDGDDTGAIYSGDLERGANDDKADFAVVLVGKGLSDVSAANFGAADADPNTGVGLWDY